MRKSSVTPIQIQIERHSDGIPILRGTLTSLWWVPDPADPTQEMAHAQITVKCPICKHHYHGWFLADPVASIHHRAAHCSGGSPFLDRGYYIGLAPGADHVVTPGIPRYRPARRRPACGVRG